jgi:hypothetical protein
MGAKVGERLKQTLDVKKLEHGGAFAAGNDESVHGVQFGGSADFNRLGAGSLQSLAMRFKIALQG